MRIHEITNPEEQLALLKLIMNNTWSAIANQVEPSTKILPKSIAKKKVFPIKKALKKPPYFPPPKPFPPPKTQKTTSPVPNQSLHNPIATKSSVPKSIGLGPANKMPMSQNKDDKEREELIKLIRGDTPTKPLK